LKTVHENNSNLTVCNIEFSGPHLRFHFPSHQVRCIVQTCHEQRCMAAKQPYRLNALVSL